MNKKIIVCDGDSWTSGDILDPKLEEIGETFINHKDNAVSYTHLTLPTTPYV